MKIIRKKVNFILKIILYIAISLLSYSLKVSFASSIVKCSDFLKEDKGYTALDGDIDSCNKATILVQGINNALVDLSSVINNNIAFVTDDDGNIPLYCSASGSAVKTTEQNYILNNRSLTNEFSTGDINEIRDAVKICGYDWNTYAILSSNVKNTPKINWYPAFGAFSNSYEYKLSNIFSGKYNCDNYFSVANDGTVTLKKDIINDCIKTANLDNGSKCTKFKQECFPVVSMLIDSKFCDATNCAGMNIATRNKKNRFYREMLYEGEEFSIPRNSNHIDTVYNDIVVNNKMIYSSNYGCFDPRIEGEKGYKSNEQRYYFRGSQTANYACDRFDYKGNPCIDMNGTEYSRNSKECELLFSLAKQCCEKRSNGGICLYAPNKLTQNVGYYTKINGLNYDFTVENNNTISRQHSIAFCSNQSMANNSHICSLNIKGDRKVYYKLYEGVLDKNSYYVGSSKSKKLCVRSANLFPYNFNVSYGTEIKDLYCDGDYISCQNPFDSEDKENNNYDEWQSRYGQDYDKIWETTSTAVASTHASSYGNVKNFCEQNVHCVEYEEMPITYSIITDENDTHNKFLPEVCFDFTKGSGQNFQYPVKLEDIEIAGFVGGGPRGFLSPMAECITEAIKNMFLNIAGTSSCKSSDETVNSEGLCGRDTFSKPGEIRHEKYNAEYSGDKNAYNYIIGEELPQENNIFFRIQNTVRHIIILFITLAIVIASAKFLITGELDVFNTKSVKAIIMMLIKIAIVLYFSLTNAWQTKFYNWLMEALRFVNAKMFEFSFLDYDDYKNDFLNVVCDVRKEHEITTKGKVKQCYYTETREILENCTVYSEPGEYEFNISSDYLKIIVELYGASSELTNTINNGNPVIGANGQLVTANVGKGGYTYGELDLTKVLIPNKLYIYVGGVASNENCSQEIKNMYGSYFSCGGYNGGGNGGYGYQNLVGHGGGGATDIRTLIDSGTNTQRSLESRIMVAGGGGGISYNGVFSGGDGGGGNNSGGQSNNIFSEDNRQCFGSPGTLTSGGIGGSCSYNFICKTQDIINDCINNSLCLSYEDCISNNKCIQNCDALGNKCNFERVNSASVLNYCALNNGVFGKGGSGQDGYAGGSGGGGGYYGGGASSMVAYYTSSQNMYLTGGGGGGSGYVNTKIVSNSGGDNGVNIGNGKATICYITSEPSDSNDVDILYNGYRKINVEELPEDVINASNGEEVCDVINETNEFGNIVIIRKCYSNCSEDMMAPQYNKVKITPVGLEEDKIIEDVSVLPTELPVDIEYKTSLLISNDDNQQIMENTYYSNCRYYTDYDENGNPVASYSDRYDGCYFGDNEYPDGKEYLMVFDTLDCKILNYYGISVSSGTLIVFLISCLFSATFGMLVVFVLTFMLFLVFVLSFKVFYIYITNIMMITLLIFVSPFIFPFLLIAKYKGIFDNWLSNLMGACFQMILLMGFIGFALLTIDDVVLGDGRYYGHDPYTGRLPSVTCDDNGLSFLCFIANNPNSPAEGEKAFGEKILNFFGLDALFYSVSHIYKNPLAIFSYLCGVLVVIYMMVKVLDEIPNFSKRIFSAPDDAEGNMSFGGTGEKFRNRIKDVAKIAKGTEKVAVNAGKKFGRYVRDGFKEWNRDGFTAGVKRTWGNVAKNFKKETWQQRGENIKNAAIQKANDIKDGAVKAYTTVKEAPGKAWNGIKRGASTAYNFAKEAPGKAWNGIKSVPGKVVASVKDKINK